MMEKTHENQKVHVSLQDQQNINKFARLNNKYEDLNEEIKCRNSEIQNFDDAMSELIMLDSEEDKVPYQEGEMFLFMSQSDIQDQIDYRKVKCEREVKEIKHQMDILKNQMVDLKSKLYAKFGDSINLEHEEL